MLSTVINKFSHRGSQWFPREENGNPLQYPCLGNSMHRGAWQATGHGVSKESDTTEYAHVISLVARSDLLSPLLTVLSRWSPLPKTVPPNPHEVLSFGIKSGHFKKLIKSVCSGAKMSSIPSPTNCVTLSKLINTLWLSFFVHKICIMIIIPNS